MRWRRKSDMYWDAVIQVNREAKAHLAALEARLAELERDIAFERMLRDGMREYRDELRVEREGK